MNKTLRTLLLFLTAIFMVITIGLWFGKFTSKVKAAPLVQTENNQGKLLAQSGIEAPVTDLVVDAMEVTQSIQDLNNTIPLVMGKRTFIRVYVHSTNGVYPTTASLMVNAGALHVSLLPIKPGGPFINVVHNPLRLLPFSSFLFELPTFYTFFYSINLTAEVNPELIWHPHSPEEYSYTNNTISKTVSFNEVPALNLVIASQPYTAGNVKYSPSLYDQWSLASWIQRAYPISQLKVFFRTLPTINAARYKNSDGDWILIDPNCSNLDNYLGFNRAAVLGNPFFPPNMAFYAMVADGGGWMRGCAPIGGYMLNLYTFSRVAAGPSGSKDWGWDFDGSYADWYGGHELGHSFNLDHVQGGPGYVDGGCGGEAGRVVIYPDGRISPTTSYSAPNAMLGFDYRQLYSNGNPILSPFWHDMMTYCDYNWISGFTYLTLENLFKTILPLDQPTLPAQTTIQDVLAIFGALNQSTGQLALQPISILYSVPDVVPPPPGDYAIVLRNADGSELLRQAFSPYGQQTGQSPSSGHETQYAYISQLVPYISGTTSVQVEGPGGRLLSQVNAGINPPAVQITSPLRGIVEDGSTITVTWTANDPDNDPLTFNVEFSADDGGTWQPAGLFYTGNQAVIDQTNFSASELARVRVWASDGIHTTRATSDVFTVPNHIPTGEIIQPSTDITVAVSQTVTFEAQVYDIDLGSLDGTSIEWSSSIDGFVGNGAIVSVDRLSIGIHTITMTADDGLGGVITDHVTVTVVPTPNDLPPQPDALTVGPDPIFLLPSSGVITATVYVDNLNLGHSITWNAAADQTWLQLGAGSGSTPDEMIVSADLPQLGFGTHTAMITFTSPQAPGDRITARVVLTIPHYPQFLPLTSK